MRFGDPLISLAAVGDDDADAGQREVEAVDALAGGGDFGEDLFPRRDGDVQDVVEVDKPVGDLELPSACLVGRAEARGSWLGSLMRKNTLLFRSWFCMLTP